MEQVGFLVLVRKCVVDFRHILVISAGRFGYVETFLGVQAGYLPILYVGGPNTAVRVVVIGRLYGE